jgi:hypothetical protein
METQVISRGEIATGVLSIYPFHAECMDSQRNSRKILKECTASSTDILKGKNDR